MRNSAMFGDLNASIRYLKGVGPKKAELLKNIGIKTLEDLFYYFPQRYLSRSQIVKISQLKEGESQAIRAKALARGGRASWKKHGFSIVNVVFGDESGKIYCVWFNQPYLKNYFKPGTEAVLYGKVERYQGRLQMASPEFELVASGEKFLLDKIVPIYRASEGISQRYLRRLIREALDSFISRVSDDLPYDIRNRHNLLNLAKSLIYIHLPPDDNSQEEAYRRLAFEEFFLYQIPVFLRKAKRRQKKGIAHNIGGPIQQGLINNLPFKLTAAQERVFLEIKKDMASCFAMQRLLQGEVGSGKTVVALLCASLALDGGYQVAFMVPTEILARQHYINIKYQISKIKNVKLNISLLTSSLNKKEKEKICRQIQEGSVGLVIGTHALLEEKIKFKSLGLVIIDEQHKFGVGQRARLWQKGNNPDCLIMTATPIPRTLSLTLYGDLDISELNELPQGRLPVKTMVYNYAARRQAYDLVRNKLREGRQAYVVCPKIEEEIRGPRPNDVRSGGPRSVLEVHQEIKGEFGDFSVGLIHGKMKQDEQDKVMGGFKEGLIDILVATTVLEVGIDVAEASVMLIEEAEQFGLAQLHQLRGRIGRGAYQSYCLLITDPKSEEAKKRIEVIMNLSDGFKIAEEDLKIRGPGEFFGYRQHGLTELRIADPLAQMHLLKEAREEARRLLLNDPSLSQRQNQPLREAIKRRFPEYEELIMTG